MRITPHFSLEEFVVSETASRYNLDNTPDKEVISNIKYVAEKLELVRQMLGGHSIIILSGYRSPSVNQAIGGSKTSSHMKGLAVDFISPNAGTPRRICEVIAETTLDFDQMIYEGTWVHLGFSRREPRHQILTAKFTPKGTKYLEGII